MCYVLLISCTKQKKLEHTSVGTITSANTLAKINLECAPFI